MQAENGIDNEVTLKITLKRNCFYYLFKLKTSRKNCKMCWILKFLFFHVF